MADKPSGFMTVLGEATKVYKISLMVIVSILVVSSAFTYLGISGVISALLVVGFIYFGVINFGLFKPIDDTNLTPFTIAKEVQAKREVCKIVDNKGTHGMIYNMVFGNQSGGKLVRDLKKLGKIGK